jgi:hypothetical protein
MPTSPRQRAENDHICWCAIRPSHPLNRALMRQVLEAPDPDCPQNPRDSARGRLPGSISRAVVEAYPTDLQQGLSTPPASIPLGAPIRPAPSPMIFQLRMATSCGANSQMVSFSRSDFRVMEVTHSMRQSELTAVLCWRSNLFHIQFVASSKEQNRPMPPERLRSLCASAQAKLVSPGPRRSGAGGTPCSRNASPSREK